ncbi:MAG: CDGSH iron-sulfur domain-containing protein [Eubacteriales bacterium]|nr:CDGSH iron-sulfur domain-containing protein [Eubacteriales bacterium]MDD3610860.1 CDGSH iron-sulfur domain-containing protein [Eubacteriales bacterium]
MSDKGRNPQIKIIKDGPYVVTGNVPLVEKIITPHGEKSYVYEDGRELPQANTYTLCRCGKSKNPPFCDGRHINENFDGTETASKDDYIDRVKQRILGPDMELYDDGRCAYARFCHREAGDAWELVEMTDEDDEIREEAIKAACQCPSGRLVLTDEDGQVIETEYDPTIEVLQDSEMGVSGPLSVKGGIPIVSADGETYEVRNRITLCRCGKSKNMPFCDGQHIRVKYIDGLDELDELPED